VNGLILQSGGVEQSALLRNCTSCSQSDRKLQPLIFNLCMTMAASARLAALAISTEVHVTILALM